MVAELQETQSWGPTLWFSKFFNRVIEGKTSLDWQEMARNDDDDHSNMEIEGQSRGLFKLPFDSVFTPYHEDY